MIKLSEKEFKEFLNIIDDYDEFIFGDEEQVKQQLETCLNYQKYWSGISVRIYFDEEKRNFSIEYK